MTERFTWRDLLAEIISDPSERHRLADKLHVSSLTLTRWSTGISMPRPESLHRLVVMLPEYEEQLQSLIVQDIPEFVRTDAIFAQISAEYIPSLLYSELLSLWATTAPQHRCHMVAERLLSALLNQLDAQQVGTVAMIALLTPPLPGKPVRSLHIFRCYALPLSWKNELQHTYSYLFGAESLTGYTIQMNRLQSLSDWNRANPSFMDGTQMLGGVSCPIRSFSRLAGCLYVGSKQTDRFLTPQIRLIEAYAQLVTLALDDYNFYEYEDIALSLFPPRQEQASLMEVVFSRMFYHDGKPDAAHPNSFTPHQLELQFWQLLEQEILDGDGDRILDSSHIVQ